MRDSIKTAGIRGAGLSFPVACGLFFLLGQPYVFALVPAGALAGLGVGVFFIRNPEVKRKLQGLMHPERTKPARSNWFAGYLFHANILIRLISLVIIGAGLLFVTWCIGYYLLPEGVLRGGAETQMSRKALVTPSVSILEEWTRLFKANLFPVLVILAGSLLMRVNRISLGYVAALYNIAGYGLFIGTNSFAIPLPLRMSPSLGIFERSGPYEMLALIVLAAASFEWSFFEIKHLFRTNPERVIPGPKIAGYEIATFFLGIVILAAANWREASMVMGAVLPQS